MKKGRKSGDSPPADQALWQQVTKSVIPYHAPKKAVAASKREMPAPAKAAPPPPKRTPAAKPAALPPAGFDRATATKLKKGQLPIDGRIDLHGMTQGAAYAALQRFILSAVSSGKRTLLIITGKGKVSEGGGILRRMLPLWLEEFSAVLAITQAQPKDGGGGAFYVRLRKEKT